MNENTELKFNMDFYEAIKANVKVATTRLHEKKNITIDSIVTAVFVDDNVIVKDDVFLKIVNIEKVMFKELKLSHAINEGYNHVNLLKHSLKEIYPEIKDNDECYIYTFKVVNHVKGVLKPMHFTIADIAKEVQRIQFDIENNEYESASDRCILLDALLCDIEDKKLTFSIE